MARCPECGQKECCGATMSEEIDQLQSHLRLLAAAALEAHKISPECQYCVRNDAPSCSIEQCEKIGCQCEACKLAREVMDGK